MMLKRIIHMYFKVVTSQHCNTMHNQTERSCLYRQNPSHYLISQMQYIIITYIILRLFVCSRYESTISQRWLWPNESYLTMQSVGLGQPFIVKVISLHSLSLQSHYTCNGNRFLRCISPSQPHMGHGDCINQKVCQTCEVHWAMNQLQQHSVSSLFVGIRSTTMTA